MAANLILDPVLSARWLLPLGVLAIGTAGVAYAYVLRRNGGPGLRTVLGTIRVAALAALILLLMRPMREKSVPMDARKPVFTVLVDTSASMNTADVGGESRIAVIRRALQAGQARFLRELGEQNEVRVCAFAGSTKVVDPTRPEAFDPADGLKTDLAQALIEAGTLEPGRQAGGVLVLSDGRDNAGGNVMGAASFLKTRQVPVWTTCVGTPADVKDVYVTARLSQSFMFAGQPGLLNVVVSQSGYPQWHVNVHLYREGQYVATRQAILSASSVTLEFPIKEDHKGLYRYRVAVDKLPGEGDERNNARTVFVRVVDDKTQVLLAEAQPYWDTKFLLRALHDDPNLNVTTVFALSPTRLFGIRENTSGETLEKVWREGVPELPRTREELYRYDCLILGRGMDSLLSEDQLKMLHDYLTERGGSIVFFRGRSYDQPAGDLAALEPMAWAEEAVRDVRLELTPDGQMSPVFAFGRPQPADVMLRTLPPMLSVTRVHDTKSLAVVLAVGRDSASTQEVAAIAYQRYGKGKVMSIGASGLWRWAFMPPDLDEFKDVHRLFWAQVIRWLVFESEFLPGQDISFRTSSYTYQPGQSVLFAVGTKNVDAGVYRPAITVYPPDGTPALLTPRAMPDRTNDYNAVYTPAEEGEYRAVLRSNVGAPRECEACFTVYSDMVETRFVASDEALMSAIARGTGGESLPLDGLDALPGQVRRFALQAAPRLDRVDAWDRMDWLMLLALALSMEWYVRRRAGLV